tara:strand:- start:708 stop:1397 length:690 start_codon:yes stop_codon:yes gene_type:complete
MADKLFQKRKAARKQDLARKKASRAERKRVLIVCEGEKTEPFYFRKLVSFYGLSTIDIQICGEECGSDPLSVVKYGEQYLGEDSDFEYVFFVFDRDSHTTYNDALNKINQLKKKNKYKAIDLHAITSVPCFEIWFLTHFNSNTKPYVESKGKSSANCVIDDLRKYPEFKGYSKGKCDYFDSIKDKIDTAIENSKILLNSGQKTGGDLHHINPTTFVHELVIVLKEISEP